MGVGAMVGAGIFALLGEAGTIAGSAVYVSFILGGVIALLSGYSLGKLGARYPSSGGIIEYLIQSFGANTFTGTMGVMMYFAAVVSMSLIAKAFGNYAATLLPSEAPALWGQVFSSAIVILFVAVNLEGARDVALWERLTVGLKFAVLSALAVVGIIYLDPQLLSPANYPSTENIFFSLSITFFAYEGFRVIANTAEDMPDPERTLPKSMVTAIAVVILLYVAVSFAVFGNLPADRVAQAKDFALAEAALPIFGRWGFTVVVIAALVSTASSINANLYAVTNVTYELAKNGELPAQFGKPIAHSREGLVVSGVLVIFLSILFDLSEIAAIGSISILLIHAITHLGHLKLIEHTRASRSLVLLAALTSLSAIALGGYYVSSDMSHVVGILVAVAAVATATEVALRRLTNRKILPRIDSKRS
jgi:amino acid transporter